jgi:tetraacyldisaccharide 4'-kinase
MINSILKYLKWLFLPLGLVHLAIVWFRNVLYDHKILKAQKLPRPVISIGNIQMGGSGKTPFTVMLLKLLQQHSLKVAVLTRGYKRKSQDNRILTFERFQTFQRLSDIGDEPALILQNLKDGILGVGANRHRVGQEVLQQYPADIFLLDDGFQHRRLHRDLNICLIDVSRWAKHPFLFPFSYLRDIKSSLRRADIIILTKFEQISPTVEVLKSRLEKEYPVPVLKGRYVFESLMRLSNEEKIEPGKILSTKVAAFCGIANPGNFFDLLKHSKFEVVFKKTFPDHYNYQFKDIEKIARSAAMAGAKWLIVTEKDAVKLKSLLSSQVDLGRNFLVLSISFYLEEEIKLSRAINQITAKI